MCFRSRGIIYLLLVAIHYTLLLATLGLAQGPMTIKMQEEILTIRVNAGLHPFLDPLNLMISCHYINGLRLRRQKDRPIRPITNLAHKR